MWITVLLSASINIILPTVEFGMMKGLSDGAREWVLEIFFFFFFFNWKAIGGMDNERFCSFVMPGRNFRIFWLEKVMWQHLSSLTWVSFLVLAPSRLFFFFLIDSQTEISCFFYIKCHSSLSFGLTLPEYTFIFIYIFVWNYKFELKNFCWIKTCLNSVICWILLSKNFNHNSIAFPVR